MPSARRTPHVITPCRSRSRLMQSLEEFGLHLPSTYQPGFLALDARAQERQTTLRARHQENLERIIQLTLDRSERLASITQPDADWLEHFLELAERASNPRMQELWSRVLLMESQTPGSFSVRTLKTLAELTPYEAVIVRKAKAFTTYEKRSGRHKIIIGYQQRPRFIKLRMNPIVQQINLARCGLSYPDLLNLIDLGLLHADMIESGLLPIQKGIHLSLSSQRLILTPLMNGLVLTYFRYTPIGEELCRLINASFNESYWQEMEQLFTGKFLLQKNYDSCK